MKLSFEVNFIIKLFINNIYEFDNDLINSKNSNKEIIEKNKTIDTNEEKSYRRKIKKTS